MHVINNHTSLFSGLKAANDEYSKRVSAGSHGSENILRDLGWRVDELSRLNATGRQIKVDIQCLLDAHESSHMHQVHRMCDAITGFLKGTLPTFLWQYYVHDIAFLLS